MNINISIDNFKVVSEVEREIRNTISNKVTEEIYKALKQINIEKMIEDTVIKTIGNSKYLSDSIIKNFVQQKIARELAERVFKNLNTTNEFTNSAG